MTEHRSGAPISTRVMNLAHFLTQTSRRYPEAVGLVWGDRQWSWAEMEARVDAMASALADEMGVRKGDRILVQSINCNQMFESMFACFRIGAVWVPANFRLTPEEVAYLAASSNAVGMICGSVFPEHAAACSRLGTLRFVIGIGQAEFAEDYDAIVDRRKGSHIETAPVWRDDPCWFFYTSGSTGRPKAAVLTHGQMGFVVTNHLCDLMPGTGPQDASIVVAPLSHGAGIHQLAQVARGVKTVLPEGSRLDPPAIWKLVERWRITNAFTVPTILKRLVEDPVVDQFDHRSLRYVIYAGAPMYRADQKLALEKLGPVLVQYFGLGEVTGNITVLPRELHSLEDGPQARIGTCGIERTGMHVEIQDGSGRPLPAGATGEICVIGPAVFAGYHDNAKANAEAFRNGWFRTGDLGHMDAEGFLYITGRASDMYISGGSNIYPREIEEKILNHPRIAEAAVLGIPDPEWGEVGLAVCVAKGKVTEAELRDWLKNSLASYKMPKRFVFWAELPKSGYGKITKKLIVDELRRRGDI